MHVYHVIYLLSMFIIGLNGHLSTRDFEFVDKLYKEGAAKYEENLAKYKELYQTYQLRPDDFTTGFFRGSANKSSDEIKADILIECAEIIITNGTTDRRDIYKILNKLPPIDRCAQQLSCDPTEIYRTFDGVCNNLQNNRLGATNTAYGEYLGKRYQDGVHEIYSTSTNKSFPNPRSLGFDIFDANDLNSLQEPEYKVNNSMPYDIHSKLNLASFFFSQVVAHDVSNRRVAQINVSGITCCTADFSAPLPPDKINPNCIPITVANNDSFYPKRNVKCLNYIRMQPILDINCKAENARVENSASSYLDLGVIYSTSLNSSKRLRTFSNGQMKLDELNVLQQVETSAGCPAQPCYIAGDGRVRQTPQLALLHSLFYRLHNLIASGLLECNPSWNDEKLFNEVRRITIALYQSIIYNEWIPYNLGGKTTSDFKLTCRPNTKGCERYQDYLNPSTLTEFANAAFRFYHTNIPSKLVFLDDPLEKIKKVVTLREMLAQNSSALLQTEYNDCLRGLIGQSIRQIGYGYVDDMRNYVFGTNYKNYGLVGIDEMLFDVMRSRDSGHQAYVKYLERCFGVKIRSWKDVVPYFDSKALEVLKRIYKNVYDIELMVGVLLEKRDGAVVGKTTSYIIAMQFYRLKFADRFFYSNPKSPYPFTKSQLKEIEKFKFANFLCAVTNISVVPQEAFLTPSKYNPIVFCNKLSPFNFNVFKEV